MARNLIIVLVIAACLFAGVGCLAAGLAAAADGGGYAEDAAPTSCSPEAAAAVAYARPASVVRFSLVRVAARLGARAERPIALRAGGRRPRQAAYPARC